MEWGRGFCFCASFLVVLLGRVGFGFGGLDLGRRGRVFVLEVFVRLGLMGFAWFFVMDFRFLFCVSAFYF